MKYASDFRSIARNALKGNWVVAVIAGLLAAILGGIASNGPEVKLNISESGANIVFSFAGQQVYSTGGGWDSGLTGLLVGAAAYIMLTALILGVAYFVLGSVIEVGYARFNLTLVDKEKEPELNTVFGCFPFWKTTAVAKLLRGVYVFLWSLLLVIPGIIAGYSYAMTPYILAEDPRMSASEAIDRSKEMMTGNRWRLFCLQLSFIGWDILCAFTAGLGSWVLSPYKQAANAAFYREVSGTAPAQPREPVTPYIEDVL